MNTLETRMASLGRTAKENAVRALLMFAKCGGPGSGVPGPCPSGAADPPADKPAAKPASHSPHKPEPVNPADPKAMGERVQSYLTQAKELPKAVWKKAIHHVAVRYVQLEKRYGKKFAYAVLGAGIAGTLTPIPGGGLISAAPVLAVAEVYRHLSGLGKSVESELKDVAEKWWKELLEAWEPQEKSIVKVTDAEGHEHDDLGQFTSHGGGGKKPKEPKTSKAPEQEMSEKAKRAKANHKLVDSTIQRYSEEHNEPKFAKSVGGVSFPDSESIDVAIAGKNGVVAHGIELKTMVDNNNNKITMKRSAMDRKAKWERKNKAPVHTVVLDDHAVFNADGPGKHDESKRVMYYRRGYGSFRVSTMHRVKDLKELKTLMEMPEAKLPKAAQRPKGQRQGRLA